MILLTFIESCKKSSTDEAVIIANPIQLSIEDAREWFNNGNLTEDNKNKTQGITSTSIRTYKIDHISWESARTAKDTNYYVVEANTRFSHPVGFKLSVLGTNGTEVINSYIRLLILKDKRFGKLSSALMHIYSSEAIDVNKIHYMDIPFAFSGNIFYTDLDGNFINGYQYVKGKIVLSSKGNSTISHPGPKDFLVQNPGGDGGGGSGCVFVVTQYYYRECTYMVYPDGLEVLQGCTEWEPTDLVITPYCPTNDSPGGSGGSGGMQPPPDPDEDIKNKIKDQCLKAMVQAAINRNIEYNAKQSMNGIFNLNSSFNLTFLDGPLNPDVDGETLRLYTGWAKVPNSDRQVPIAMDIQITLNSSTIPNSTQEYIDATILHEALHAYFRASNTSFDHQVMVDEYIPWFKASLKALYPGMSDGDLEGLAYGGLMYRNPAFSMSVNAGMRDIYQMVNQKYKTGISGKKCGP